MVPPAAKTEVWHWHSGIGMEVLEEETLLVALHKEEARVQAAKIIKEARTMADAGFRSQNHMNDARNKLVEALNLLEESNTNKRLS